MNLEPVLYVLGRLFTLLACVLLVPLGLCVVEGGLGTPEAHAFVVTAGISMGLGYALRFSFEWEPDRFGFGEAFASITFGWLACTAIGALPFLITGQIPSVLDALFESLSGFTTTGATVLSDPQVLSRPLLFWRSMTHWIGGMGFLAVTAAVLPALGAGGNFLFTGDIPGPDQERLQPRLSATVRLLWTLYMGLTAVEFGALWWAGMEPFDALCHAFTLVSTGGFSTRADSLASFGQTVHWLAIGGMFLGGINIVMLRAAVRGQFATVATNPELRLFVLLLLAGAGAIAWGLSSMAESGESVLTNALFVATSTLTTTGLTVTNTSAWPMLTHLLLLTLLTIGACSGSTGSGIKIARVLLLAKIAEREVRRLLRPAAVFVVKVRGTPVHDGGVFNISAFLVLHLMVLGIAATLLVLLGQSMETAFTATLSAISNFSAGTTALGSQTAWADFSAFGKLVLMACMLLGRLEFYSVLVLLLPLAWRR
jgi:trk system potassium uptake protein TrkH